MRSVFLFADSLALLALPGWWEPAEHPLVYVGCFNGDVGAFFDVFASQSLPSPSTHFVAASATRAQAAEVFEGSSEKLVFLSGGECEDGMDALESIGVDGIRARSAGLSAGAMVLAPQWEDGTGALRRGFAAFDHDVLISVHDEENDWACARAQAARHHKAVLCIPTAGAAVMREGGAVEAKLKDCILILAGGVEERLLRRNEISLL